MPAGPPLRRRAALKQLGLGAAALLAAPALTGAASAPAAPLRRRGTAGGLRTAPAGKPGLHGATLDLAAFPAGTSWEQAISGWEGYSGTLVQACKVYFGTSQFPTMVDSSIQTFIDNGIKVLISFKPAIKPFSSTDMTGLANALNMYKNAGLNADVTLWQEPEVAMEAVDYIALVRHYGPMVRESYPLVYDAGSHGAPQSWANFFPGGDAIDKVAVDYYAGCYITGVTLDTIAGLADSASTPLPFGIWEMGVSASPSGPTVTESQVGDYFAYVQSFMAARLQAGKVNAEIAWYNGDGINTITSKSDYKAPLWTSLVNGTKA